MPLGALVGGLLVPPLIQRLGSATVASVGLVVPALALAAVPLSGGWAAFAVLMFAFGASDAAVDAGQNAHGFRVQRRYGRSLVNGFHGLWSVGAVVGGLLGSAAAGLQVPLPVHLSTCAVVFTVLALTTRRLLLPGPEDAEREPAPRRLSGAGAGRGLRGVARGPCSCCWRRGCSLRPRRSSRTPAASWSSLFMRQVVGTRRRHGRPGLRHPAGDHDRGSAHRRPGRRPARSATGRPARRGCGRGRCRARPRRALDRHDPGRLRPRRPRGRHAGPRRAPRRRRAARAAGRAGDHGRRLGATPRLPRLPCPRRSRR